MSSCLTVNMQKEGGWACVKPVNSSKSHSLLVTLYITGLTGITTRYLIHTKNRNNVFDET